MMKQYKFNQSSAMTGPTRRPRWLVSGTCCYDFIVLRFKLTIVFLLRICSQTLCAQWTCHVLRTHLLRIPVSCITCHWLVYSYVSLSVSRTFTNMDWRLISGYLFVSLFSLCLIDSSMLTFTAYAFPFVVCQLVCQLVISGTYDFWGDPRLAPRTNHHTEALRGRGEVGLD